MSWVRATGRQPWLGIASSTPPQHGRARLLHGGSEEPLLQLGPLQRIVFRSGETALDLEQLDHIRLELTRDRMPPVTGLLLNDASFLARETATVDAPRALLAAAMACEIKAKEILSRRCRPKARQAVDDELKRTSNLPRLLHQLMLKATGHSLKQDEPQLHEKASRLFHLRNEIVHEGRTSDPDEAWPLVASARQIVEWLDQVEPREEGESPGQEPSSMGA